MPKVKINTKSNHEKQATFEKISHFLENDSDLRKLDPKYTCQFDASNLSGTAKGQHFKADMTIQEDGNGSEVQIVVDLPFHLALAKGMVEKTLKKKLEHVLG